MMTTASKVIAALAGKTLVTAESLTGGGIGGVLTSVPGASKVFKGGVISYTDEVKRDILGVARTDLQTFGAVSAPVAQTMAEGVRRLLQADIAVSVTGLAGPDGDTFGHPVGTVFIGYASCHKTLVRECHFPGDREAIRTQTIRSALEMVLENL